jgi:hypothetical protein
VAPAAKPTGGADDVRGGESGEDEERKRRQEADEKVKAGGVRVRVSTICLGPSATRAEWREWVDALVVAVHELTVRVYSAIALHARGQLAEGHAPTVLTPDAVHAFFSSVGAARKPQPYAGELKDLVEEINQACKDVCAGRESLSRDGLAAALQNYAAQEVSTACMQQPRRVVKPLVKKIVYAVVQPWTQPEGDKRKEAWALAHNVIKRVHRGETGTGEWPGVLGDHVAGMRMANVEYKCTPTDDWKYDRHVTQYFLSQARARAAPLAGVHRSVARCDATQWGATGCWRGVHCMQRGAPRRTHSRRARTPPSRARALRRSRPHGGPPTVSVPARGSRAAPASRAHLHHRDRQAAAARHYAEAQGERARSAEPQPARSAACRRQPQRDLTARVRARAPVRARRCRASRA